MKTLFADENVLCKRIRFKLRVSLIIFKNLQLECILQYVMSGVYSECDQPQGLWEEIQPVHWSGARTIDVLVWFFHFLLVNVFSTIFSLFRNIIMWNSLRLLWREKSQPVPGAPKKACFALLNFSCPAQPGENHWPVASHWQTLSNNVVSPERESNSQR